MPACQACLPAFLTERPDANLPRFLIEDAMATGELVLVLPGWEPSAVEMTALWQRDRITGRLIKAIVSAFEEAPCTGPEGSSDLPA